MKVKVSVYTDKGYTHSEQRLDDAVQDLIDNTPDGHVVSKLINALADKGVLTEAEVQEIFDYADKKITFLDRMFL